MTLTQVHQLTQIAVEHLDTKLKKEPNRREASVWKELMCKYKANTATLHNELEQNNEYTHVAGGGVGRKPTKEEYRNAMAKIEGAWK